MKMGFLCPLLTWNLYGPIPQTVEHGLRHWEAIFLLILLYISDFCTQKIFDFLGYFCTFIFGNDPCVTRYIGKNRQLWDLALHVIRSYLQSATVCCGGIPLVRDNVLKKVCQNLS